MVKAPYDAVLTPPKLHYHKPNFEDCKEKTPHKSKYTIELMIDNKWIEENFQTTFTLQA